MTSKPLDAVDIFYGPMHWSEKVARLRALVEHQPTDRAKNYLARANSIAKFTCEPGDFQILGRDGEWEPLGDSNEQPYGLVIREQAGGLERLEELGAMDEIAGALLAHCDEFRPAPPYKPELLEARLAEVGWMREPRVPPPSADLDELPINDRYDALKFFRSGGSEVGVAIEMEGWEINNDLIKFWRGFTRGQIVVGVLVQPDPATVRYCFDQMRLLTQPLFGHLPMVFIAPDAGLKQSFEGKAKKFARFPMPNG